MTEGLNILRCYKFLCPLLWSLVLGDSIAISLSLVLLFLTGERLWRSEPVERPGRQLAATLRAISTGIVMPDIC